MTRIATAALVVVIAACLVIIASELATARAVPVPPGRTSAQASGPGTPPERVAARGAAVDPLAAAAPAALPGKATWYDARPGTAAAGSELRAMLGRGYLGREVTVCRGGRTWQACVKVRIVTSCKCRGRRVIDLSRTDFAALGDPVLEGVIRVTVLVDGPPREQITNPPTDTAP